MAKEFSRAKLEVRREPDLSGAGLSSGIAAPISASPSSVNLRGSSQNLQQEQMIAPHHAPPAQLQIPAQNAPTAPQTPLNPLSGFIGSVVSGAGGNGPKATAAAAAVDSIMKGAFSLFGKKK